MPSPWTPVEDAILTTLPVAEVERLTGRTMSSIIARRVEMKRRGELIADQRTCAERLKVGRSVWTHEADELVRQLHPREVAQRLGVSISAAVRRRAALGLPPIGRRRKPPRTTPKRVVRKWTKKEIRLVLDLPPDEAEDALPNRSASAIHTLRCRLRRKGIPLVGRVLMR